MKLIAFLASRKFAIAILIASAAILIAWRGSSGYYTPAFLAVPAFLFLSISVCIARRTLERTRAKGWSLSFVGSFVFHIGLLAIIASASVAPLTRFQSTFILPQGMEVKMGDELTAVRNLPFRGVPPFVSIRLNQFDVRYEEGKYPVDYAANLSIGLMGKGGYAQRDETVRVNAPLLWDGYQFMLEKGRLSPLFILRDKGGKAVFSQYMDLSEEIDVEDSFEIPSASGGGLTVYTRFFPDVYNEGRSYGTRSLDPVNPAFGIRVIGKKDPFNELWKGVLKPGQSAYFNGMTFELAGLKRVVVLAVVKDPTYYWILAGWLLIVAGLVMRYALLARFRGKK